MTHDWMLGPSFVSMVLAEGYRQGFVGQPLCILGRHMKGGSRIPLLQVTVADWLHVSLVKTSIAIEYAFSSAATSAADLAGASAKLKAVQFAFEVLHLEAFSARAERV